MIIAASIISVACAPDPVIDLEPCNDKDSFGLTSITEKLFDGNFLQHSAVYNFHNGILENVEYLDGSYDIISYANGLVTQIDEYDENDIIDWTRSYVYDSEGRLIYKTSVPIKMAEWDIELKEFSYEKDKILTTHSFFDANNVLLGSDKWVLSLGDNKLIVREELETPLDNSGQRVEYYQGNPLYFFQYGLGSEHDATVTYSFSDNPASEAYHLTKFMFGKEWKNNTILNKQFNLDYEISSIISNNYLTGYLYKLDATQDIMESLEVDYEFDLKKRLVKQLKLVNKAGRYFRIETVYEYNN